jgi:hypothetical protein
LHRSPYRSPCLLKQDGRLREHLLPGRAPIECLDLGKLVGREVGRINGRHAVDHIVVIWFKRFEQLRHHRIELALDFGTPLNDCRLEPLHDQRQHCLELVGHIYGGQETAGGRQGGCIRLRRGRRRLRLLCARSADREQSNGKSDPNASKHVALPMDRQTTCKFEMDVGLRATAPRSQPRKTTTEDFW